MEGEGERGRREKVKGRERRREGGRGGGIERER